VTFSINNRDDFLPAARSYWPSLGLKSNHINDLAKIELFEKVVIISMT